MTIHPDELARMPPVEMLLTTKEIAAAFRLNCRTIERLAAQGKLPAPIYIGRSCRWRACDITAYLNNVKEEPVS